MRKAIFYFLTLLIITSTNLFSQSDSTFTVTGEIFDSFSGDLVGDGTLTIESISVDSVYGTAYYDKHHIVDGKFEINLPKGDYYFGIYLDNYDPLENLKYSINSDTLVSFTLNKTVVYQNSFGGFVTDDVSLNKIYTYSLSLISSDSSKVYYPNFLDNGEFYLENIKPGIYNINCGAFGYDSLIWEPISIESESEILNYEIKLTPSSKYSNLTINIYERINGIETPVSDVAVYLSYSEWLEYSSKHYSLIEEGDTLISGYYKELTDETGKASFNSVVGAKYFVDFIKEGYQRIDYDSSIINVNSDNLTFKFFIQKIPEPTVGFIKGNVFNENNNKPLEAYLEFHKRNYLFGDSVLSDKSEYYYYTTISANRDGVFETKLDTGKYKIRCYYFDGKFNYRYIASEGLFNTLVEEYYNNSKTFDDAHIIEIKKDQTYDNVLIGLDYIEPTSKRVKISGAILDNNNHPVDNADVYAHFNNYYMNDNFTTTNSNGEYELELNVFDLYDEELRIEATKDGYTRMYYKDKVSWYSADPFLIKKSSNDTTITDINFSISKIDLSSSYEISGIVTDSLSEPLAGIYVEAIGLNINKYYTAITDSLGKYKLNDLIEGSYIISFYGNNFSYEYYNDTKLWEEAEILQVNSNISNINAVLEKTDYIGCYDLRNSNSVISGKITDVNDNPIIGAYVSLISNDKTVKISSVTNKDGEYSFNSIKLNNYNLIISKVNYQSYEEMFDLTESSNKHTSNIKLLKSITNIEQIDIKTPDSFNLHNNYPNPFNPSTKIKFDIPEKSQVKISIYNIIGEEINVILRKELDSGTYTITFEASELTSGIYLYSLETEKIKITKKMILIK